MAVPVVLHLMMKRKPRHQVFPAMRFLQQRQIANQRQLRLRHWLLLLLRIAAIGLLAALFAKPSVDSVTSSSWIKALLLGLMAPLALIAAVYCWMEEKGIALLGTFVALSILTLGGFSYFLFVGLTSGPASQLGDQDAPVAAAIVFDTSPRMGLLHQSQTRLQEAQTLAKELLQELPPDSEVAIVDASGPGIFSVDLSKSINMVESLQVLGQEYPLAELVRRGVELVADRNDKRKEVFILTDLSEVAWTNRGFGTVRRQLEQQLDASLFILDVGVKAPRNLQLGDLRLNADSLALGQVLRLETSLRSLGPKTDELATVEVMIEEPDSTRPVIVDDQVLLPESKTRDRGEFPLIEGTEVPVTFALGNLPEGIHHGRVELTVTDGLPIDDVRYFTVEVRPPSPVLLVTSGDADSRYVEQAISPTEYREQGQSPFQCRSIPSNEMSTTALDDFVAVALLDPGPLPSESWKQLEAYVQRGGSLAIFLGRNASAEKFASLAPTVLPGTLGFHWRTPEDEVLLLSPSDTSHPILSLIRDTKSTIAWDDSPIFRHWSFTDLEPDANVILRYSNNQPAIIESILGKGTVLTMTTPVSDPRKARPAWNQLPTSDLPLPFFVLMYGMFPYLADQSSVPWNYRVGEAVELSHGNISSEATWQLFTPAMDWQNLRSSSEELTVANTNAAGQYRLKLDQDTALGFSANLPQEATNVKRLEAKELDNVLGAGRYTLTRGTEELARGIGQARIGRELFPFLMLSVVGILAMEYLVSNRFYGPPKQRVA